MHTKGERASRCILGTDHPSAVDTGKDGLTNDTSTTASTAAKAARAPTILHRRLLACVDS